MTRLHSLSAVSQLWQAHDSPWRTQAVPALQVSTGYSSSDIHAALDAVFAELSPAHLSDYYHQMVEPILGSIGNPRVVLHIAAGNVFTAWLHGVVITLLMGHTCWMKPSSAEPVFMRLWSNSLKQVDVELAQTVTLVPWHDSLPKEVDAVIAYGADATIDLLRQKFPTPRFIGYGHKWSFGIMFSEAFQDLEWPRWRKKIERDTRAFHLQGCLSPQILFVQSPHHPAFEFEGFSNPSPTVRSFKTLAEIREVLSKSLFNVTCIGVAGSEENVTAVRYLFGNSFARRICSMGMMQQPPLAWRNGGISLVEELSFATQTYADH